MISQEQWDEVKANISGDVAENTVSLLDNYDIADISDMLENGAGSDIFPEMVDGEVSIYYHGLLEWLKNDDDAVEFIEEAVADGLVDMQNFDFWKLLSVGQYVQIERETSEGIDEINDFLNN